MKETSINYPASLPNPLREGHGLNPVSPFRSTEMDSGRSRNRLAFTSTPTRGAFDFIFTDSQAMSFEAWFRDVLNDGVEWFNVPRKTPLGVIKLVCKFTGMYTGPTLWGRDRWRFSCPLEVWERPLLPRGWGHVPELIMGASIIDRALNKEWPEA